MRTVKQAEGRTLAEAGELRQKVEEIIRAVREAGDGALLAFGRRFEDSPRTEVRVSGEEIKAAYGEVSEEEIAMLRKAADHIRLFAEAQRALFVPLEGVSPMEGVTLGHRVLPVDACCCYVPGGGFPLYSTALMLGIPAKVAGVPRVIGCSPTMKGTGRVHPKTLVAMDLAGMDEIYAVGGAQAIAAAAYGTESIRPVDLIVGPGNSYVTEAKRQCFGQVGIDFLAGPSEVLVLADGTAPAEAIAADLLAQSEHDPVAKGILVTTDPALAQRTVEAVARQLDALPDDTIARASWDTFGEVLVSDSLEEAIEYANAYAPEHLELMVRPELEAATADALRNYGSLFLGACAAEVFGDYATGTNHTLPTLGAARYTGGLWAGTFLKVCTHQKLTEGGAADILPLAAALARGEGLEAHARAAEARKKKG